MAMPAYMSITGETQKDITREASSKASLGVSYQESHANQIKVIAFEHTVAVPRDPLSGTPTSKRVHHPLRVTKPLDRTSPLLMQALTESEGLVVTIQCYRPADQGEEPYYEIILDEATIVEIRDVMPDCLEKDVGHRTQMQEVSFAYKNITWKHLAAGTEAGDDWSKS
jgi:type VI secretion system secreted protein Hcp